MKFRILLLVILLFACALHAQVRLITQLSYAIDGGTFTDVDVADSASVNWADVLQTTGLPDGLHQLRVRATDDTGRVGVVTASFFATISNNFTGQTHVITQLSYQIDSGTFTNVDVADGSPVSWNSVLATVGLPDGLHQLRVRGTDDLGRTGVVTAGFFATISNNFTGQTRLITQLEYRFDSDPFTPVDVSDAGIVDWNQILSTNALPIGLHRLDVRGMDDTGRLGQNTRALLVVTSPIVAGETRTIVAAEFWVNTDPGPGNGTAIPLPNDGAYDEGSEDVDSLITGLPLGLHRVGFRTRDDLGRWSSPVIDSLIVGPVLVIRRAAPNSIVLDWQSGPGVDQFKIYRAATSNGAFALIDSTTANTYTDVGITGTFDKRFYHVTFETSSFSTFRMPDATPAIE